MQVKVFEAQDMSSGLKMVKETLGPDALILSTRTIRKSRLGVLGKSTLEITAAVDAPWPEAAAAKAQKNRHPDSGAVSPALNRDEITYDQIWRHASDEQRPTGETREKPSEPSRTTEEHVPEGREEIRELRAIIESLSQRLNRMDTIPVSRPYIEPEFHRSGQDRDMDCPLTALLLERGLAPRVAELVARFSREAMAAPAEERPAILSARLVDAMARLLNVSDPMIFPAGRQKRISLVGPTGVGKTTTVAKLAAAHLQKNQGKVGLITIDTYRIAAVEQLKVYGEIMNLPVQVVIRPDQMDDALEALDDCDLILIDTAGRSPDNTMEIQEMASFLRPELGIRNLLLLAATARETELNLVIDRFSCLPLSHFVFTKIDECLRLGVLMNIHYSHDTPIAYLTNGQRVPEDILTPSAKMIAQLIMNNHGTRDNG